MNKEKYNGWKNRSTWLAVLHLDNTNLEVYNLAKERAIQANTKKQFKNMITPILVEMTKISSEKDFNYLDIDIIELWNHLAPSTKY